MKVSLTPAPGQCQSLTTDIAQLQQSYQKQHVTTALLQSIGEKLWNLTGLDTLPEHLEIISDQPNIHEIPWEMLYHPTHGFVALTQNFHLTRSFNNFSQKKSQFTIYYTLPLKILLFTAQVQLSSQNPPLLLELEQFTLRRALAPLIAVGKVKLYAPDDGRFTTLCQLLQQPWDIVILSGHGFSQQNQAGIWFETDDHAQLITHNQLRQAFTNRNIYTVILTACQSLKIAIELHQLGIPHVIGMWENVLDRAACCFIETFCKTFVVKNSIVTALQQGRVAMTQLLSHHEIWQRNAAPDIGQWSLPILFSNQEIQPIVSTKFLTRSPPQEKHKFLKLFIGRRSLLRRLSQSLQQGTPKFLWLGGKSGVGKTALAQHLAFNLIEYGYTVIQYSSPSPQSLLQQLKQYFDIERESQLDTLHYLTEHPYLLLIDGDIENDAECLKILAQWDSPKLRIIITTCQLDLKLAHFQELQLQPIDYTDFCRYICAQGLPYSSFQLRLLYQATQGNFHAIQILENFAFPSDTTQFWQNIAILQRYLRSITD